ncbi:DASH family cryptochrome [uncultured Microscilla sp.]|uniref:DASH family cryptochrome n=1 Tax=uncultured Microscilla sp. TaxID=432653 RepID=UPI0026191B61|nr:DASH family cryptochrome [uncultured Microscilla sp.]
MENKQKINNLRTRVKIVWFRNDLRVHDNDVLAKAANDADYLLPVYCFDPRQYETTSLGFAKTGAHRARFLIETLANLRANLEAKGSGLVIRIGKPEEVIADLAKTTQAKVVYASQEIGTEEDAIVKQLEKRLWKNQVFLELLWTGNLIHPADLPFPLNSLSNVFTDFRKEIEQGLKVREAVTIPDALPLLPPGVEAGSLPQITDLGLTHTTPDTRAALHFKGGETAGLQRIEEYIWQRSLLQDYKETRNGLLGADYSTKFSPWLANGAISARMVYHEIKKYEHQVVKNKSTYHLVFELLWREYFRLVARKYGHRIFVKGGIKAKTDVDMASNRKRTFKRWKNGETGIPFIDANMRELNATGFMSNRGRQNVASYLAKDLKINWVHGAMYFESQLIDYDVSSNWCNWNYVAGVGNDPRKDRYFDIPSQASRYDAKGAYVKHWLPELANLPENKVHEPHQLKATEQQAYEMILGQDYPKPIPCKK